MSPPPNPIDEIRLSSARILVTFGSLAAGQAILGERDVRAILLRSATGAALAEGTAMLLRYVQRQAEAGRPIDPLFLASYGARELERFHCLLVQATLQGTLR